MIIVELLPAMFWLFLLRVILLVSNAALEPITFRTEKPKSTSGNDTFLFAYHLVFLLQHRSL